MAHEGKLHKLTLKRRDILSSAIYFAQTTDQWRVLLNAVMKILTSQATFKFSVTTLYHRFVKSTNYDVSHYAVLSSFMLLPIL
jgi:hypothetical protein